MKPPKETEAPLTAAEALKEEFLKLHGPPSDSYHQWLDRLPAEPKLWLLLPDHLTETPKFLEKLRLPADAFAQFVRSQLSPRTTGLLDRCAEEECPSDKMIEALSADLNQLITSGQSIYEKDRFAHLHLTPETTALLQQKRDGQKFDILNRLLLEEAFPEHLLKVWDTLGGVFALMHTRDRTALCFSGGGIRSATFALGVAQGLAQHGLLDKFDYLSTVSGGGYIGSWLTSWIHHAKSVSRVAEELQNQTVENPLEPEPKPLRHLRQFSNYLTPKLGLFSADTWTLIGTYLRNLLLNWLIFVPFLFALFALPRLCVSLFHLQPPGWVLRALLGAGFLLGACGVAYGVIHRPSLAAALKSRSPFWTRRGDQRSFLIYCLAPLWTAAFCFTTVWVWLQNSGANLPAHPLPGAPGPDTPPLLPFVLFGLALHLTGWLIGSLWLRAFQRRESAGVILSGCVGGVLLWGLASLCFRNLHEAPGLELYACFSVPIFMLLFLISATVFIGLASRWTGDSDREWWARMGAWMLIGIAGWSLGTTLILFGPLGLLKLPALLASLGGAAGLFTILAGQSGATPADKADEASLGLKARLMNLGLSLAAPLFIACVVAGISLATTGLLRPWLVQLRPDLEHADYLTLVHETPVWMVLATLGAFGVFGWLLSRLININRFSLHAVYRNRLIRAYLGASNANRNPNPFTGFDSRDNLRFHNLEQRPLHVVNMALNLVSTNNLAWQQRKAETFTANALHVGNFRLGYRRADEYALNERDEGLSLGTAITISGAAASPNQGYHSSPTIAMLMTLFNVRLGAWLGNPGAAGNKTFRHSGPKSPVFHVFKEAFGLTSDDSPYVYLSDGGHFENLGLYEMVLRRCHYIVVSDAGCDPKCQLEDLGNALRKIRIDLGIPITMHRFGIYSRDADKTGRYCAVGTIHYDKVDGANARPGLLLYLKPAICGGEPQDIFNYKETSPLFPHEPTSDQWFSESQFESYRMLGQHIVQVMADDWERVRQHDPREHPLATFIRQSYKYLEIPFPPELGRRLEGLGKTELHRGDTVRVGREASPATPGEAASPKAP